MKTDFEDIEQALLQAAYAGVDRHLIEYAWRAMVRLGHKPDHDFDKTVLPIMIVSQFEFGRSCGP